MKARIWDYPSESMIYGVGFTPESDGYTPYTIPTGSEGFDQYNYYPESVIMRYVGRDKNFADIYEDDLFKIDLHWDIYKVTFKEGSYGLIGVKGSPFKSFEKIRQREYELSAILGNIHENPELLESH